MNTKRYFLKHNQIDALLFELQQLGYKCVAPRNIEGAINYHKINYAKEIKRAP